MERWKAMCDEYDDERMVAFWRRLEELEARERLPSENEETIEPLVHAEPAPSPTEKPRPRTLVH